MLHPRKPAIFIVSVILTILACLLVVGTIGAKVALVALGAQAAGRPSDARLQAAPDAAPSLLHTPTPTPDASGAQTVTVTAKAAAAAPTAMPPAATPTAAAPTVTPTPASITAQVSDNANLRSGPGTDYEIVGSADAGQQVTITGASTAGDWYQLDGGRWIAAFLVGEPNAPVPTLPPTPTPNAAATAVIERRANATATVEARAYTAPEGVWCEVGSARRVCVGKFKYMQSYGYYSAPSGGRLVNLGVSVTNISNGDIAANPNDVTLVTADGRSHPYDTATFAAQQPFEHVIIAPGDDAVGVLVFVTANDTAPERIIYRGGFWEDPIVVDLRKEPID